MARGKTAESPRQKLQALILFVAFFYLSISLLTYSPTDPSFNRVSYNEVNNFFGNLGAFFADPLIQIFGFGLVILVSGLLTLSVRCFFSSNVKFISLRVFSLVAAVLIFNSLISIKIPSDTWPFYIGYGGLSGDLLGKSFAKILSTPIFIAAHILLIIPATFFALAVRINEVKTVFGFLSKCIRRFLQLSGKYSLFALNFVRGVMGRDPILWKKPAKKAEVLDKNIIEYNRKKSKEKTYTKQQTLDFGTGEYMLPDLSFLVKSDEKKKSSFNRSSLEQNAKLLKSVLEDFGIHGEIIKVRPGPVVTLYELEPSPGTKSSRVIGLADDIARSMSSVSARISVIPGRNVLGIELPNAEREIVYLRELLEADEYQDKRIRLPLALGRDIGGDLVMADLAKMPHLLIAGTTGSGKSVAVNAMILSYIYRLTPDECKFIMIDPKMLELSVYDGIPHLLAPVVTEPKKAIVALKWAVREMEERYRSMSNLGVRNITGYNKKIEEAIKKGTKLERQVQTGFDSETGQPIYEKVALDMNKLPFIVIIVDEMADLMLTAGKDIEASIQRLAQMARAAGIHMVMATQRPSVDVITGVIKANFPTRISFQVTSRIDSRTILGEMGAEQLLGMGDMLYMAGGGRVTRVHGPFVDDKEVEKVVKHLKSSGKPNYIEDVTKEQDEDMVDEASGPSTGDELYDKAVAIVLRDKKASTSYIQRQLKIGYNRAANLIEKMEKEGVVSSANHVGKREILVG